MVHSLRWLFLVLTLAVALHGCGNKGELILESDVIVTEELKILNDVVADPDGVEDDEKPRRKSR